MFVIAASAKVLTTPSYVIYKHLLVYVFFRAVYQRPWMGRFHAVEPLVECPGVRVFAASQGALFRSVMLPSVHSIMIESKSPDGILKFTVGDCLPAVHNLVVRS